MASHEKVSSKHMLDLFFSKNLQDDSVEILVRVDSVEMFCLYLIL